MQRNSIAAVLLIALLLQNVTLTFAFQHGEHGVMALGMALTGTSHTKNTSVEMAMQATNMTLLEQQSYFTLPGSHGLMVAHIILMSVGWVLVLPINVFLSVASSGLAFSVQLAFLVFNGLGLLTGTIYNGRTPDMYENNMHHKLGWAITWIVCVQATLGIIKVYSKRDTQQRSKDREERSIFLSESAEHALAQHQPGNGYMYGEYEDSRHSIEQPSRSDFISSPHSSESADMLLGGNTRVNSINGDDTEKPGNIRNTPIDRFLSQSLPAMLTAQATRAVHVVLTVIERSILILGFIELASGIVTYGGIFKGRHIFGGMAHFVKGGVFFWYGLLTLGRVMGCFAELGWAWNVKPSAFIVGPRAASSPSAEFAESFLIFFYGLTNVWLEHLGGWGKAWTAQDFEHVSIAIMFFGGGLCGMLIESARIREMLNSNLFTSTRLPSLSTWIENEDKRLLEPPRTYNISINPIPGLVILLVGILMSSHHQESMLSTRLHSQWGILLAGAAFARAVTYVLTFVSPPTSLLPSRPPSEFVVAFCLLSGGLIFMASNGDTVDAMERYNLNAMFVLTVTMGFTFFLMSWVVVLLIVKGWAVQRASGAKMSAGRNFA